MTKREYGYHYPYGKPSKTNYSGFKGLIPTIRDSKPADWDGAKASHVTLDDVFFWFPKIKNS